MGDEWILLDFWTSMFCARVRIALAEKGIKYECREEDLRNKSRLLLEMNPVHKKVPVLIHNGKPICESLNIVRYIDEVSRDDNNGYTPLLSCDPYERAQATFWADFIDKKLHPAGLKVTLYKSKEELQEGKKEYIECLKQLEQLLGEKPYFGGEILGYLDVALGGFCGWFYVYEIFYSSMETECPKLMAWTKRCMERESFSKSFKEPHELHNFIVKLRKKRGLDG